MRILCLMVVSVMLLSAALPVAASPNEINVWGFFEALLDSVLEVFDVEGDSADQSTASRGEQSPPTTSNPDDGNGGDGNEWGIMIDPNG